MTITLKATKNLFVLSCLILLGKSSFAQYPFDEFDIGFKRGFKEGYCYNMGINCSYPIPPLTPMPTINERRDSYQDGYNRGFQTGLDTRRANGGSNSSGAYGDRPLVGSSPYRETIPIDAYRDVAIYKQKLYNSRFQWIQNRIDYLQGYNEDLLRQLNPTVCNNTWNVVTTWFNNNLNGKHLDLADNDNFNQIVNALNYDEKYIHDNYLYAISLIESNNKEPLKNNSEKTQQIAITPQKVVTKEYSGEIEVVTHAPILGKPGDRGNYKIGEPTNNKVTIISKYDDQYYKVRSGNIEGYMWVAWFK